jgi:hypothetical protein
MKKIIYLIGIATAFSFFACSNDYLEAPAKSSLDESVIFSTPDLAKSAVDGIKVSFGETNSYRGRFLPWYGMNTDIEWYNSSESSGANSDLAVYNTSPNNSNMNTTNNAWAKMYEGIERANICIRGLREFGNPEPDTELGYLLGEALTLRAVYYSDLLKAWGDVPARFEPIATETLYLPKTSRDTIYKQLIADLDEAATLVPWPNATTATQSVERVNKAFVKGLRARLCLAASGYSQYPDGIRRSTDPDLSVANMYTEAKADVMDVINSGTCKLESSFETVFRKNCEDNVSAGGESLWEIPFSDGRGRMLFTFAVRHRSTDKYTSQARGGQAGPTPNLFYDYDLDDTRRDVSCVPYEWASVTDPTTAQQSLLSLDTWQFGKFRYEWMNRIVTSSNDDGVNKLYMRYAEVVLMAAEIMNELEGPSAAAPYLKMIRQRAFPESVWTEKADNYVSALTTKEAMFNAIVLEHKFEFSGEMLRKQALIRWNLLKTKLDEAKTKMYALRDRTGEYSDVPETLYYGYDTDDETLLFYGLNRGETEDKSADFESNVTWVDAGELEDTKIESIYARNPDDWQFWPIWQVFLDSSNGMLTNDYGY